MSRDEAMAILRLLPDQAVDAMRLYHRKDRLEQENYDRLKMRLYNRLEQFLKAEHIIKDGKRLIKRLKRHKNELFRFLEYKNPPITIMPSSRCENRC